MLSRFSALTFDFPGNQAVVIFTLVLSSTNIKEDLDTIALIVARDEASLLLEQFKLNILRVLFLCSNYKFTLGKTAGKRLLIADSFTFPMISMYP